MNEGLNPHRPSVEERIASFARTANILAAFARVGASVRARTNALAEVLHALEVPARAKSSQSAASAAEAIGPQERGVTSMLRSARPLASVLAAGRAQHAPIVAGQSDRTRSEGESPERRSPSPRAAMTRALAAVRAGNIAVARVRQLTLRANLQSDSQQSGRAAGGSAISEPDISSAPRALNLAAVLTASGVARRTIAADRQSETLRWLLKPSSLVRDIAARRAPAKPPARSRCCQRESVACSQACAHRLPLTNSRCARTSQIRRASECEILVRPAGTEARTWPRRSRSTRRRRSRSICLPEPLLPARAGSRARSRRRSKSTPRDSTR